MLRRTAPRRVPTVQVLRRKMEPKRLALAGVALVAGYVVFDQAKQNAQRLRREAYGVGDEGDDGGDLDGQNAQQQQQATVAECPFDGPALRDACHAAFAADPQLPSAVLRLVLLDVDASYLCNVAPNQAASRLLIDPRPPPATPSAAKKGSGGNSAADDVDHNRAAWHAQRRAQVAKRVAAVAMARGAPVFVPPHVTDPQYRKARAFLDALHDAVLRANGVDLVAVVANAAVFAAGSTSSDGVSSADTEAKRADALTQLEKARRVSHADIWAAAAVEALAFAGGPRLRHTWGRRDVSPANVDVPVAYQTRCEQETVRALLRAAPPLPIAAALPKVAVDTARRQLLADATSSANNTRDAAVTMPSLSFAADASPGATNALAPFREAAVASLSMHEARAVASSGAGNWSANHSGGEPDNANVLLSRAAAAASGGAGASSSSGPDRVLGNWSGAASSAEAAPALRLNLATLNVLPTLADLRAVLAPRSPQVTLRLAPTVADSAVGAFVECGDPQTLGSDTDRRVREALRRVLTPTADEWAAWRGRIAALPSPGTLVPGVGFGGSLLEASPSAAGIAADGATAPRGWVPGGDWAAHAGASIAVHVPAGDGVVAAWSAAVAPPTEAADGAATSAGSPSTSAPWERLRRLVESDWRVSAAGAAPTTAFVPTPPTGSRADRDVIYCLDRRSRSGVESPADAGDATVCVSSAVLWPLLARDGRATAAALAADGRGELWRRAAGTAFQQLLQAGVPKRRLRAVDAS